MKIIHMMKEKAPAKLAKTYNIVVKTLLFFVITTTFGPLSPPQLNLSGGIYYISPNGKDSYSGLSNQQPWATFTHAWTILQPGDTLYLMDGTYYQTMNPTVNGEPGKYVTVKALNDGKAFIDGQDLRDTVVLGKQWNSWDANDLPNPQGNYFDVEGLVAFNSSSTVFTVYARNIILRRDSGYNSNPFNNEGIFEVWSKGTPFVPANILIEDSVGAGSARKVFLAYDTYVNVVFRRNFAAWQWWSGDNFCQSYWPQADGIEIYPLAYGGQPDAPNNSIVENNINFGLTPDYGISLAPNPTGNNESINGNNYLGDISIGSGMKWDNLQEKFIPAPYDQPACTYNGIQKPFACPESRCIDFANNYAYRGGFVLGSSIGTLMKNNLFQDLFAWGNGSVGLTTGASWDSGSTNNRLIRATLINNGQGDPAPANRSGVDAVSSDLARFDVKSDLKIGNVSGGLPYTGGGAKLQYRYVNGTLTNVPLWPWPMEERIMTEFANPKLFQASGVPGQVWLNFSVTNTICPILAQYGAVSNCTMTPWRTLLLPLTLR
jgi:hypothetical protein